MDSDQIDWSCTWLPLGNGTDAALKNDGRAPADVPDGGDEESGSRPQVAYSPVVSEFSGFRWNEYFWQTTVDLADRRLAALPVPLRFAPEGRGEGPLSDSEMGLVRATVADLEQMTTASVLALFGQYPAMQDQYGYDRSGEGVSYA